MTQGFVEVQHRTKTKGKHKFELKSNFVYSELTVPNFFEESWCRYQCEYLNQTFSKQHLDWFNICWLANSPQELPFNIHTYGDTLEMAWYHRYEDLTHLWEGNIFFKKKFSFIFNFLLHNSHDKFDRQIIVSNQTNQTELWIKHRCCAWVRKRVCRHQGSNSRPRA